MRLRCDDSLRQTDTMCYNGALRYDDILCSYDILRYNNTLR